MTAPRAATKASTSASTSAPHAARPMPIVAGAIGAYGPGTFGPRVVRAPKGAIVVSGQRSTAGRRWIVQALDAQGALRGDAKHEVAEAPEDTTHWDVEPLGDGFILAWTRATDAGQQLLLVSLAIDGAIRGAPSIIARTGDELVAVDVVPLSGDSALLTWGEASLAKGGSVPTGTLMATVIDAIGRPTGAMPTRIAEHLSAWHVIGSSATSAIAALIERDQKSLSTLGDDVPRTAKAVVIATTPKGLATSDAALLTPTPTALPDTRIVRTGPGRALVVWEDRRDLDTHLYAQALDLASGKPKTLGMARRATPSRGDASLAALTSTPSGPVLLWEAYHPRPIGEARRRFEVVRLSNTGEPASTPRALWYLYDEQEPEIAAMPGGDDVAMLTYGGAWLQRGDGEPRWDGRDVRPFVLRLFGPTLAIASATMLDVGTVVGGPALHAFDLTCTNECVALVDGPGDPALVAIAHVPSSVSSNVGARWIYRDAIGPAPQPRLDGASTIGREAQFAGLRAARTTAYGAPATFVAWITYADDEAIVDTAAGSDSASKVDKKKNNKAKPRVKKGEGAARVAVRLLDAAGEPLSPITVVSERALSKGDVAVSAAVNEKEGALVAYVSRAEGDDEVYVAHLDRDGKKSGKSSRITRAPGNASDVALAALPDGGWLLAWVDARKDAPAVWAVRLDKSGAKQGSEVRIGGGVGDVSDLTLAIDGLANGTPRVLAAWSDARDDLTTGFGDIYFTIVSGKDPSKALVAERALTKTRLSSHAPVVSTRADGGATFAWIEDDPQATELLELTGKPEWGAYVARLDASGTIVQGATRIEIDAALGAGVVTGVALDCVAPGAPPGTCRTALAWAAREGVGMLVATVGNGVFGPARMVWSFRGAPTQEVAPALVGSAAYLCEDGLEKDDGRVRRLAIAW